LTKSDFRFDVSHNFKMAATRSFHAEKCRHLVSEHEASTGTCVAVSASSWSIVHSLVNLLFLWQLYWTNNKALCWVSC